MGSARSRIGLVVGAARTSRATRPSIDHSIVATGRGDDGTTGLLYGGRVDKDDPRTDAYGTIDEAVAALGLARAEIGELALQGRLPADIGDLGALLLDFQRGLFVAGAELAANPDAWDRLQDGVTRVDESMLITVETALADYEARITMPKEFVVPGASRLSAALELARTVLRRAERRVVTLRRDGAVAGAWLVPYLNRLADLVWVFARAAEQAEQRATDLARTQDRRRR
ncbi:MAG: cob(I)yrinic acid a,c-diamide adenosyltransferase [Candidatus Limnocylindrales bacterium]